MTTSPVRVISVEDNPLVAEVLGRKLSGVAEFQWLGCVGNQTDLLRVVESDKPHVVCMDLHIPGQDAYRMISELATKHPESRVLVLTGHITDESVNKAVEAGAWGCLSKAESTQLIVNSICRVAAGEFVLEGVARQACGSTPPVKPGKPEPQRVTVRWNPLRALLGGKRS